MTATITGRAQQAPALDRIHRRLRDELVEQRQALNEYTATLHAFGDDEDIDAESRRHVAALRQRAADAIAEIEAALACLDAGTYGTCEACGEAIALARLEALPATRHCISCAATGRTA